MGSLPGACIRLPGGNLAGRERAIYLFSYLFTSTGATDFKGTPTEIPAWIIKVRGILQLGVSRSRHKACVNSFTQSIAAPAVGHLAAGNAAGAAWSPASPLGSLMGFMTSPCL